jgi:hypothetical protein
MQLIKIYLLFIFILINLEAKECSPYFNPDRFYDAPEFETLFKNINLSKQPIEFDIEQKELYRFEADAIASDINDQYGEFWINWIADAYEMQLVPEQTLIHYKEYYFSLEVFIYGVLGDATKFKGTLVKYHFYNYTPQVEEFINCQKNNRNYQ